MEAFFLSKQDRELLLRLIAREKNSSNVPPRSKSPRTEFDEYMTPDVYVALTPDEGIWPLSGELSTGTGTGTGTEIGQGNSPGWAECEIYRVEYNEQTPNLIAQGFTRRVHTLSFDGIDGGVWMIIARDKWGEWWAIKPYHVDEGVSGGSLTVEDDDGTPSYDEIDTLQLEGDHFTLTNPGSGIAKAVIKYQMSITADASGLKFVNDASTPGNSKYYGTDSGGTKGWFAIPGAGLTVEDDDSTPTYSGITTLRFDQDDGFVITNPGGAGVAQIDLLTADSATIDFSRSSSGITAAAITQMSVTSDGSGLKLSGDEAIPSPMTCYASDGAGVKGWRAFFRAVGPPTNADSPGEQGEIAMSTTHFYCCVGTDEWKRVAISTWV